VCCGLTPTCFVAEIAAAVDDMEDDHIAAAAEPDDDDFEAQVRNGLMQICKQACQC